MSAADIDVAHRYGRKQGKSPRPTVVTFATLKAKNLAFNKAGSLRNLGFPVSADLPQEWVERRKKIRPFFIQAKQLLEQGKRNWRVKLQDDKLKLDGKLYSVSNLHDLPSDLSPAVVSTPMDENSVLFFTKDSPLSNHYLSGFAVDNLSFNCAEQYIMSQKALLFKHQDSFKEIMKERDPKKQKSLGKNINSFDQKLWQQKAETLITPGIRAKFTQNEDLKKVLISTGARKIAEANLFSV